MCEWLVKAIRVGVRNSPKSRGAPTRVISRVGAAFARIIDAQGASDPTVKDEPKINRPT